MMIYCSVLLRFLVSALIVAGMIALVIPLYFDLGQL